MSDKEKPDYDEINRLERELFPEWFADEKRDAPKSDASEHEASAERRRTVGRKNPDWKPTDHVLLDKKPEPIYGHALSSGVYFGSSTYMPKVVVVPDHNSIRLRKVDE